MPLFIIAKDFKFVGRNLFLGVKISRRFALVNRRIPFHAQDRGLSFFGSKLPGAIRFPGKVAALFCAAVRPRVLVCAVGWSVNLQSFFCYILCAFGSCCVVQIAGIGLHIFLFIEIVNLPRKSKRFGRCRCSGFSDILS